MPISVNNLVFPSSHLCCSATDRFLLINRALATFQYIAAQLPFCSSRWLGLDIYGQCVHCIEIRSRPLCGSIFLLVASLFRLSPLSSASALIQPLLRIQKIFSLCSECVTWPSDCCFLLAMLPCMGLMGYTLMSRQREATKCAMGRKTRQNRDGR